MAALSTMHRLVQKGAFLYKTKKIILQHLGAKFFLILYIYGWCSILMHMAHVQMGAFFYQTKGDNSAASSSGENSPFNSPWLVQHSDACVACEDGCIFVR
jgi:hypothetical protein